MNTDRMSCGEVRERLPLYVGRDLDSEVLDAVRGHLERCGDCARRAAADHRARQEFVGAFRGELLKQPPVLWPGIRSALRAEGLIHESARPKALVPSRAGARAVRWRWALAPLAAAAVLLLVTQLSGVFGRGGDSESGPRLALPVSSPAVGPGSLADVTADVTPVALPGAGSDSVTGGLRRVDPNRVPVLHAYQRPSAQGRAAGGASLAGFRGVK